jgi:hypothetical protein
MHIQNALLKNRNFAQWLLQVGNGSNFSDLSGSTIHLHSCINIAPSITFFINNIYNNIDNMTTHDDQYFQDWTILGPHDIGVDSINKGILQSFPGIFQTF